MRLDLQIALSLVFFGTDLEMDVLSPMQIYLDILCHVTYILDILQADLRHRVVERSVLRHVDSSLLESDHSDQSHSDQDRLVIPDSVCSDSPSQAEGSI